MPIYKVNGDTYDIPASKQEAFEKKYPDASVSYLNGSDEYEIPLSKRDAFVSKFPKATLKTYSVQQQDSFPMFDDEPNAPLNAYNKTTNQSQNQPEQDDNVETNFFKGLHQTNKNIWQAGLWHSLRGEIANLFTGSSREEQAALNDIEYLESVGIDPREYLAGVEDAEFQKLYGMNREQFDALDKSERRRLAKDAASRQGELSKDAIKALEKERKQRQSVIDAYQDALAEAGGDLDKAKEILRAKAEDKTWGDEQIEKANAIYAENKELQGAAKWGGLLASGIPSAAALGLSFLTKGKTAGISRWLNKAAKLTGNAGMAGMSAGTAGLSMIEARQHGATNWETWTTGIADGLIEFITEKIPFDKLTKPVLTAAKTRTTKALMDAMRHVDSPGRKELEKLLTEANKKLGGKLLNGKNVADWLANAATEGVSEATAEALQTVTSMIYLNPEEYPTFAEVANAAWEGAKGGIALGGVLGGAGKAVEHSLHKDRRKQQGFVNVALVEQEGKNPFVAELVDYDPETKTYKALQDGEIIDVNEDEIQYKHQYTYNEFESGRYRQLEDEAIADGTVSDAQVAVSADRLGNARQKLEKLMTEAGMTDEQKNATFADLEAGDMPGFAEDAKALWDAADEYSEAFKRDKDIQSARNVKAENERKAVLDAMTQQMGGEFWQKGSRTMQENGMEIIEPDMVEVGTMQDGKQVFILSTPNDNGEVSAITEDGKKMFVRHTDLQDGTTIMPLQEYLDARVSEQKKVAEQARMAEEAAPQLDAIRQKYQIGAQVNLGTEDSPTLGQVIGIKPENDGVFIQTQSGVIPYTFEQLADIEGTPIRVMTDAQMTAAEAAEIEAAESARMGELAETPKQMTDAETVGDNAVQMENMATETPLPTNPDGSVNEDALFRESPERWAVWNDEQSQDGGVSSAQYIETKLAKAQARLAELQNMYSVEDSLNKKRAIQAEIVKQQGVVEDLAAVMQKYTPAETIQSTPVVAQQERTAESVLASLNDGTLTDEEIRANIDANLAEAQKAYDKYEKKAPKMGIDKDAYLAEKKKYEQGLPALQQEIDFWNGVKQTYDSAIQQETMPTEESFRPELVEEDMEPQTPQELAARELGLEEGGIKLLWDSVKAHTGFGDGERQKFFGIFRSKDKGGMTIEAARDRLMEIDREYDLGLLDQSDPMAGVNAILDVLGDVQTIGDLRNYIANNREAQVAREAAAAYSAMNAEFETTHGMTMEEWAHANEVQRIEIMSKSALTEAEEYERNVKFAEEEYQYGTNEHSTGTEGLSGGENQGDAGNVEGAADGLYRQGDSILQEAQSDNTGGETVSAGQAEENVSESDNQDGDTSVHAGEQTEEVDDLPPAYRGVGRLQDGAEHLADPLAMTIETRLKIMAETREAIHERVNTWSDKLGIKINIIDNYRDVQNKKAKANIASANPAEGEGTWGWFEKGSGEVFIYVPDFLRWKTDTALQEVDKTVLHEAIAHKGLSEMLGKERFGELCDKVWQEIMNDEQREKFIKYSGVSGNTRAAADEFIAKMAESVKQDTVWDKIANFFKDILNSIGIEIKIADNDLKGLLKQSYQRYRKREAKTNPGSNQQAEGNTSLRSANGSLVGMHNISEDKLRKVLKQGGLANPSTAVVNIAEYLLDGYGDISLIMPSSLVDANTGDNIGTYTGDAWTPTYPPISRKVDDKGWKVIKDLIRSVVSEDSPLYHDIINGLENYLEDNRSSKMEFVFLKEKGIEPKIAYKGADGFVGMRNLEAILGVQGLRDGLESYERYKNASPMAKRSFNMWLDAAGNKQAHKELKEQIKKEPKLAEVLKLNEDVSFADFDSFTYDIFRKEQDAGRIDTYDTMGAAARYVDANNLRGEFEAWLESLMEQAGAKEVFFAGFTRSGERIYKDNTLENVSRHMRLQGRTNAYDDHGLSATKSALLQRLTSLSQIRKNKARLQNESAYNKEYDALKDRLFSIISQLADMQEISSNRFMNVDYAESRLQEAITKRNPVAHLNKEYGYGIDPAGEYADELNSFIKDVQQMPAKYFETKFERPVYLNEFAAAVMPTTTSEDIKQAVSEAGLPIFEYDSEVEGSRKEATLKATEGEGIRFRTVSDINSQFDAELQQQIEGTLPQGHVYQLGMPSGILKSTGVPDLPIALQSSILNIKANDRWHPFDLNEIKGLVNAIQKPWAIFSYGDAKKAQNLIVGISKGDKQFLVGISLNPTVKGKTLNINSVRNVFPKDNDEWLNWIQEGKLLRVDEKEKIQAIIDALRINPVDYTHLDLDSIAKIVENFENPSTESETRFRTSNNNQEIFVSNAAKAVEGIKQEKATPEQWLKMIEKNGGLKAGEDKWMGLSDWLKASDKKTLTKQEVLDFINENMIIIEEEKYGEVELSALQDEFNEIYDNIIDNVGSEDESNLQLWEVVMNPMERAWEELRDRYSGGDDFDMAFSYDSHGNIEINDPDAAGYFLGVKPINETRLDYTTSGLQNKQEIALVIPAIEPWNERDDIHFGDAGDGRAVAWIRFGETKKLLGTTEVDGKKKFNWAKVLVIDEIQSKRHQEGREKGYRVSDIEQWLSDNNVEVVESGEFYEFIKNGETDRRFSKGLMNYDIEKAKRLYVSGYNKSDIPDAPFDKNWHELAMKRMLRYAAENGYDVIAWTKGEQQADRYNLGKIYNEIEREDNPNIEGRTFSFSGGNYDKVTVNEDGVVVDSTIEEAKGKPLSDLVGKDLAVKMMSLENYDTIDGEDLRIGGEGMKGFYDRMLPAFMNKYGKKWGVKVEDINFPGLEGGLTMHSVSVTEEMKESVMEGQVMFRTTRDDEFAKRSTANNIIDRATAFVNGTSIAKASEQRRERERKRKKEATEIYSRVLNNQFDDVTLQLIDKYIQDATPKNPYGRRISQRLPQEMERGLHEGKREAAVNALFSRISESAVSEADRASQQGKKEIETKKKELLKNWAITSGMWYDNLSDVAEIADTNPIDEGTESKVYASTSDNTLVKVKRGKPFGKRFRPDIDDLVLFNHVFPNTAYTIIGYGDFGEGISTIVTQPVVNFAEDANVSVEERVEHMKSLGFKPMNKDNTAFTNGKIVASDIQGKNIVKTAEGNIRVIDADMKLHTRDMGGNHVIPPVEEDVLFRTELEKLGVPFIETNNQGKPIESTQFRTTGTPTAQVVKDGLVFSSEDFTNLAGNIFSAMPEDVRRKVVENAARDNYDLKKATLQMSARLAEKAELADEEIELAKVVAQKVEDAVLASGVEMTRPFTTNEALWVLYQSIYPTSEYDLIGNARKAVVAYNLGFSKSQQAEQEKDADNIRFRSARGVAANSAAAMYNNEQRSAWGMLRETYQDMYRSVKSLMQSIEKATGKVAQSWENILTSLNALSSKNLADKKKYLRDFLTPMWDAALAIRDKYHKSLEQIERYLMIKHGLERNKVLAARDARNFYREQADQEIAAIKADKSLSKAEQKARIQRVEDTYDNHVLDIEAGIDAKFQEFRAKDYGGLTALFSDFADYGTREDYESEELYQEAALAARTPKYATLAETELAAQQEVEAFEKEVDKALIDNLWKKINAATKETLRHQYANNMLTKEQYERVRDMFEFYVPLRGFVDTTAEETYSYYVSGQQSKFANPLQRAKGRKTQAETPLGWIGSMAESAIQMDNKNTAKLALYYFAVNRPDNDILKITPTWYEWTGEVDSDGKKIFEPVYPTFNGPQSGPAMQAQMDAFESMMEQQAQAGNAYKGKQRIDLKEAVIRAPKSAPEHVVTVKVAGEDYSIIINANPRAAQAINGMLNIDKGDNPLYRAARAILRFQASIKTSLAPLFWITNFMRDMSFAFINTSIRNDAGYTKEFAKNYPHAFRVFSYVHKNRKAALGDSKYEKYYTEFAENGGITGYTSLTNNTEYDQMMKTYANNARAGKFIKGIKGALEVYQDLGESFEQVSRFAAYITAREAGKDISESIYEAKEVTINFNRKGSGKAITWEESGKMRRKNGKPLTDAERIFFVTLGGLSPVARSLFMFFNAGMQGVRMIAKLAHEHPGKSAAWAGIVFTMGLINAIMHAMMEDDDEYLDMPDYVRRTNILIGKNGAYFKWSLPHEVRPFYAMADIFVQHAMGRKPNENIVSELAETFGEWMPINPFKDGLNAFTPDIIRPFVEIKNNKDFTGSPIYREYRWLTEDQQKNMPAYEKGFDSTSKVLVDISEILNDVSGGDHTDAGFININPAVVEHLAQEYGGGPLKLAEQFFKTIGVMTGDQEFSIRNTPFLSTFMVAADDRYRNAHTTELFKYYKGMAEDVKRRAGEYKAEKDKVGFDKLRASDDFQIFQIYRKYEKRDKFYNEQLKRAKSDSERKEIMSLQDAHRKRMIEEISKL